MRENKYIISAIVAGILVGCGGGSSSGDTTTTPTTNDNVTIAPTLKNADFSEIGLNKINTTLTKSLNYEDALEKYVVQNDTPDGNDNYVRSVAKHGTKIAVASVYHNALTIFDTSNNSYGFSPFAAYANAGDDKDINGKELTESGEIDGVSQASENWLNEVKFSSDGDYVYLNVRPKYLGRTKSRKVVPDPATYGLYKAKILDGNKVDKDDNSTIRFTGQFYFFDFLNDGGVMTMDANGTFYKLDKDLKEISNFTVENVKRFDVKNDKLYVLVDDGTDKYIQQHDIDSGTALGDKIPFTQEYDSKGYSSFEMTPDGSKVVTFEPNTSDAEVCVLTFATKTYQCNYIGVPLKSSMADISPNGKYAAFTAAKGYILGSIVNIENKPALVGQFTPSGRKKGYGVSFSSDNELICSANSREIEVFSVADSGESITNDTKLAFASNKIFSQATKDINSVEVETETDGNTTTYEGDISFIPFLYGANISYTLSSEFKDYINEKGEFIKQPTQAVTGTITANFTLLKDGQSVGTSLESTSMTIKPSN